MRLLSLPSINYASVAPSGVWNGDRGIELPYHVLDYDCVDARAQAFHRDALPVLLPYWDEFEDKTWWASQQLLFHFAVGCFPSMSHVKIGGFNMVSGNEHGGYPRGVLKTTELQQFFQLHVPELVHGIMLQPGKNASLPDLNQPHCRRGPEGQWQPYAEARGSSWQDSSSFQLCRAVLASRWEAFARMRIQ